MQKSKTCNTARLSFTRIKKIGLLFVFIFLILLLTKLNYVKGMGGCSLEKEFAFTTTENYETGIYQDINTSNNQLALNSQTEFENSYLWVANNGEGTVSKIDTRANKEVARYYSSQYPQKVGSNNSEPSRTAVDIRGDAWIGNRKGTRTIVKIAGSIENCEDRNHDGVINTSTDSNHNGVIESSEMIPWGDVESVSNDECLLKVINFTDDLVGCSAISVGPRALVIDQQGYIWVGLWCKGRYIKLDPNTGQKVYTLNVPGHMPYGATIDSKGYLWSVTDQEIYASKYIMKIDTISNTIIGSWTATCPSCLFKPYGIVVDKEDNIWIGNYDGGNPNALNVGIIKVNNTNGQVLACYSNTSYCNNAGNCNDSGRIIAVDNNGKIWYTSSRSDYIYKFNPQNLKYECAIPGSPLKDQNSNPVGIFKDIDGKIWVLNQGYNNATKINPDTCTQEATVSVGTYPYSYSDATGALLKQLVKEGWWSFSFSTNWAAMNVTINWTEQDNSENNINVTYKDYTNNKFKQISKNVVFDNMHPSLTINITLLRNSDYISPKLSNLLIESHCKPISLTETNCTNGLDEDCDCLIDLEDPDCAASSNCLDFTDVSGCNSQLLTCAWNCSATSCPPSPIDPGKCLHCSFFSLCGSYNNQPSCDTDPCNVKETECSNFNCNRSKLYGCFWDSDDKCKFKFLNEDNQECSYSAQTVSDCQNGFHTIEQIGTPAAECPPKTNKILYPTTENLSFFGRTAAGIAVILIVIFYIIKLRMKKSREKHTKKQKQQKK